MAGPSCGEQYCRMPADEPCAASEALFASSQPPALESVAPRCANALPRIALRFHPIVTANDSSDVSNDVPVPRPAVTSDDSSKTPAEPATSTPKRKSAPAGKRLLPSLGKLLDKCEVESRDAPEESLWSEPTTWESGESLLKVCLRGCNGGHDVTTKMVQSVLNKATLEERKRLGSLLKRREVSPEASPPVGPARRKYPQYRALPREQHRAPAVADAAATEDTPPADVTLDPTAAPTTTPATPEPAVPLPKAKLPTKDSATRSGYIVFVQEQLREKDVQNWLRPSMTESRFQHNVASTLGEIREAWGALSAAERSAYAAEANQEAPKGKAGRGKQGKKNVAYWKALRQRRDRLYDVLTALTKR